MIPYYDCGGITIYHGDCREVIPMLGTGFADIVIADPPYGQTSLQWDVWPIGWPAAACSALKASGSMWCFGSMRLFLDQREFRSLWSFVQDVVWEKHNGSSFHADRFKRVHELALQFTPLGVAWGDVFKAPVFVNEVTKRTTRRKHRPAHTGNINSAAFVSEDGGPKLQRSVIYARSCHGYAQNETQKPVEIVGPLVEYSCPPGGTILSPFAGSGTDGVVAKATGRKAILIETREAQCEIAATRLSQETFAFEVAR